MYVIIDRSNIDLYDGDFVREAMGKDWIFEIICHLGKSGLKLKSDLPTKSYWSHNMKSTDRIVNNHPYMKEENELNKLFEI